jgi:hypothetical protein
MIDLRANNWVPRRKEAEAKTIAAARAEAISEKEQAAAAPSPKLHRPISRDSSVCFIIFIEL